MYKGAGRRGRALGGGPCRPRREGGRATSSARSPSPKPHDSDPRVGTAGEQRAETSKNGLLPRWIAEEVRLAPPGVYAGACTVLPGYPPYPWVPDLKLGRLKPAHP